MSLIPAGARLAIVDPPADPPTGLILPPGVEDLERGVVLEVGAEPGPFAKGDVVFFPTGRFTKVGDVKIVAVDHVLAYEDDGRSI